MLTLIKRQENAVELSVTDVFTCLNDKELTMEFYYVTNSNEIEYNGQTITDDRYYIVIGSIYNERGNFIKYNKSILNALEKEIYNRYGEELEETINYINDDGE